MVAEPHTNGKGYRWHPPAPIGGPGARHRAETTPPRYWPVMTMVVIAVLIIAVSVAIWVDERPHQSAHPVVWITKTVHPSPTGQR